VPETFSNESKEIWATDFKILLQRKDVVLPKDRQLVAQIHSIKRRLTPTGKPSFEPEREEIGADTPTDSGRWRSPVRRNAGRCPAPSLKCMSG